MSNMSLLRGYIQSTTISFHNNDPGNDTLEDSGDGFVSAGFVDGDSLTITGSTSNNGIVIIDDNGLGLYPLLFYVLDGEITLDGDAELTEEAEGDTVTITGTPWEFSPLASGFDAPEERDRTILESLNGEKTVDEVSAKKRWGLPVNAVSAADYTKIKQWWNYGSTLRFNPDTSFGTVYNVRIINETCPLVMMQGAQWNTYYEGIIILEEI